MLTALKPIKKREDNKPLHPRVMKFLNSFIQHGNASQAAKDAGYPAKWAGRYGYRILQTRRVRQAVEKLRLDYFSKGYVLDKYNQIAQHDGTPIDRSIAIKALQGISAIQGHNAPIKTQSENLNISSTLEDIRSILGQYQQDE